MPASDIDQRIEGKCPYCRFQLASSDSIVECETCGSAHHEDCWNDNGGCAVFGCASSPSTDRDEAAISAKVADAQAHIQPAPAPTENMPPVEPPVQESHVAVVRSNTPLIAALIVLAAAVIMVAAAVIATSGNDAPVAVSAAPASDQSDQDSTSDQSTDSGTEESDSATDAPAEDPADTVEAEADPVPPSSSSSDLPSAGWVAQLGSFTSRSGAEARSSDLNSAGMSTTIVRSNRVVEFNPGYWVVYSGPFSSKSSANAAAADGRGNGISDAFVRYATPR